MKPMNQKAQAECTVEHQVIDPKTLEGTWEIYETMTIQAPTIEHVIERAHLYVGRPERHDHVSAIRLTGTMTVIDREKDSFYNHEDTIKLDLNILRERTIPVSSPAIASGQ